MFELYQSGEIIEYLDDEILKKFILKLRSNIIYNRIGLRDMCQILRSIISKNLNMCLRIHPDDLQSVSKYLNINHNGLYSRCILRSFKDIRYSEEQSLIFKSLLERLLEKKVETSDKLCSSDNGFILQEEYQKVDLDKLEEVIDNMKYMESRKMAKFWTKEYPYTYLELMLNTILCLKIRKGDFKWVEYLDLKRTIKKVIERVPNKNQFLDPRFVVELSTFSRTKLNNIDFMKLLKYEYIFKHYF